MGSEIARILAQQLGFRLAWRDVINEAAQRIGSPDLALHVIDEFGLLGVRPSQDAQRAYQNALSQVLHELAAEGNVIIVGRAGQAILQGHPDMLHVRIIAPAELRAERLMREHQVSLKSAKTMVEASDRARKSFLRKFYGMDWNDPQLYDLTINTAHILPQTAAALIAAAYADMFAIHEKS